MRFSIRNLLFAVTCVGITLALLARPTEWTAWMATRAYYFAIVAAPLGIIFRRGEARAFWIGFTILGWGLIVVGHWTGVGWTKLFDVPAEQFHQLYSEPVSKMVSDDLELQFLPPRATTQEQFEWSAHFALFLQIAAAASAMFLSLTGGTVAVYLECTQSGEKSSSAAVAD